MISLMCCVCKRAQSQHHYYFTCYIFSLLCFIPSSSFFWYGISSFSAVQVSLDSAHLRCNRPGKYKHTKTRNITRGGNKWQCVTYFFFHARCAKVVDMKIIIIIIIIEMPDGIWPTARDSYQQNVLTAANCDNGKWWDHLGGLSPLNGYIYMENSLVFDMTGITTHSRLAQFLAWPVSDTNE